MTITLHWWLIPILLVVIGFLVARTKRFQGDGSPNDPRPILGLGIFAIFVVAAIGVTVGHFL